MYTKTNQIALFFNIFLWHRPSNTPSYSAATISLFPSKIIILAKNVIKIYSKTQQAATFFFYKCLKGLACGNRATLILFFFYKKKAIFDIF